MGLEKQDKRFKNAQSHLNKVKNKYGDNITVTGHSLGGSISEQLARSKNLIDVSNRNDPTNYFSGSSKGKRKQNVINTKGWHSI